MLQAALNILAESGACLVTWNEDGTLKRVAIRYGEVAEFVADDQ